MMNINPMSLYAIFLCVGLSVSFSCHGVEISLFDEWSVKTSACLLIYNIRNPILTIMLPKTQRRVRNVVYFSDEKVLIVKYLRDPLDLSKLTGYLSMCIDR